MENETNKTCLDCSESFSEEPSNPSESDRLYCMLKNKYVDEKEKCEDFN